MTAGTVIHLLLLFALVVGTTDWKLEARKAQERLSCEHQSHVERSEDKHHVDELVPSSAYVQREDVQFLESCLNSR